MMYSNSVISSFKAKYACLWQAYIMVGSIVDVEDLQCAINYLCGVLLYVPSYPCLLWLEITSVRCTPNAHTSMCVVCQTKSNLLVAYWTLEFWIHGCAHVYPWWVFSIWSAFGIMMIHVQTLQQSASQVMWKLSGLQTVVDVGSMKGRFGSRNRPMSPNRLAKLIQVWVVMCVVDYGWC